MKHLPLPLLFLTSVFFLQNQVAQAQWAELPLPVGPYIYNDMETHHGRVYVSTYADHQVLCASTSDNLHWSLQASLPVGAQYGLSRTFPDGEWLYLFAWNKFLHQADAYRSTDDAQSWTPVGLPIPLPQLFLPLGEVLLCATDSLVLRSTDGGISWETMLQTPEPIWDMEKIGDQTSLLSTSSQLYRSTDSGASWTARPAPYAADSIAYPQLTIFPTTQGLFVELHDDTISTLYRSLDGGDSWSPFAVPTLYDYSDCWDLQTVDGQLWGAFGTGVAVSADSGATWSFRLAPNGTGNLAARHDTLFAGGSSGFFKSYDAADTWFTGNLGWDAIGLLPSSLSQVSLFDFQQGRLYLSTWDGLFSTIDDGQEWQLHSTNGPFHYTFSQGDSLIFVGRGALRSFDNGTTWEYLTSDDFENNPLSGSRQFAQAGKYLFAGAWFGDFLFRSADWGASWQALGTSTIFIDHLVGAANRCYIADSDGIRMSSNYGQGFSAFNNGLGNFPSIYGLWAAENMLFTLANDQLFRLVGNQWKPASAGLYNDFGELPHIGQVLGEAGRQVAVGYDPTVPTPLLFASNDAGQSWQGGLAQGLPVTFELTAALNGHLLYLTGEDMDYKSHIWKRDLSVGTADEDAAQPEFTIQPNPAQDGAWLLANELSGTGWTVVLHDVAGRQVWESECPAGQPLQLPVAGFPTGLYVVTLRNATGTVARERLIVQR